MSEHGNAGEDNRWYNLHAKGSGDIGKKFDSGLQTVRENLLCSIGRVINALRFVF